MLVVRGALLLSSVFLVGCNNNSSLSSICSSSPEICEDFSEDTWCRMERTIVIFSREAHKSKPSEHHKFDLLINYEQYQMCLEKSSKIEHRELKHKQTNRIDNLIKVKTYIEQLTEQTKYSTHPRLTYYHWSRFSDQKALQRFLALEGTSELSNHQSQLELASYYAKRDPQKTLKILYRSLELVTPSTQINNEVFKTLASIFTEKKEFKQAYIWLKVLTLHAPEDKDFKNDRLSVLGERYQLDTPFLNKVAQSTLNNIQQGTFKSPKI